MNKKYFIINSIDNPHIFLCFSGDLIEIKQVKRNVHLYKFSNIDVLEDDTTIYKYVNNCTFQFYNNKRSYINILHSSLDDISKNYRELFKDRYKNKYMWVVNNFVYDSYELCIEELKKENEKISNHIDSMVIDLKNRLNNIENVHIF